MSEPYPFECFYEDLIKAIVIQAADDYKRCRFIVDTIDLRDYKNDEVKYMCLSRAKSEIRNVVTFMKSPWFTALSGLNGAKALKALNRTYINEYYPVRMEELLNENKTARFRALNSL